MLSDRIVAWGARHESALRFCASRRGRRNPLPASNGKIFRLRHRSKFFSSVWDHTNKAARSFSRHIFPICSPFAAQFRVNLLGLTKTTCAEDLPAESPQVHPVFACQKLLWPRSDSE